MKDLSIEELTSLLHIISRPTTTIQANEVIPVANLQMQLKQMIESKQAVLKASQEASKPKDDKK